jgi:regulator of nonsense transcripts 2
MLICKIMLKACRRGRYKAIQAVASVAAKLRRHKPEVCIRLVDTVLEELQWSIEHPAFKDQQRTLTVARLLGELYCSSLASGQLVIQQLYKFINFGHEIPDALRDASEKQATAPADMQSTDAGETGEQLPVFNSASGAAQAIQEDEEMESAPLETREEAPAEPNPVAVSSHSKHDPRVPTPLDPPNSVFRIKLVCTLFEVVSKTIITRNNLTKIEGFLAAFQRYLFTKTILPTDVEFSLLDTFDMIDSQWKKTTKDTSGKGKAAAARNLGFPRYITWLEAHNVTVHVEETEAIFDARAKVRLEAVARDANSIDEEGTLSIDDLNDDDDMMDDDDDFSNDDALSTSARDSLNDDQDSAQFSDHEDGGDDRMDEENDDSQSGGSDEDDDSDDDDDDDDSEDDDASEEEFDEQAYMQQLEAEAFERELRRLTMDALEKGKATTRGGKVADNMPTGSQFIKKKSNETVADEAAPSFALGGKEGVKFQLLKKGNKGKVEARQFFVPTDTNLAAVATKQDDEAARERDMIKARVLQYEAESAELQHSGGNVYLEQEKLQVIRNRPLSMEEIDRNFGTTGGNLRSTDKPNSSGGSGGRTSMGGRSGGRTFTGGPGGRTYMGGRGGRGRGRGGGGRTLV